MKCALLALAVPCLLAAADANPRQETTATQRIDFPSSGELDLKHLSGELTIEGWDQPAVEVTSVKYTPVDYTGADRDKAAKLIQEIRVNVTRNGDRVVVETSAPKAPRFLLLTFGVHVDIDYHIKVPKKARLVIEHRSGEVHIMDVAGDIRVGVREGLITLMLPADGGYDIDAGATVGDVYSDFPGIEHDHPWRFAHAFAASPKQAAHKLHLRIKFGDIIIRQEGS